MRYLTKQWYRRMQVTHSDTDDAMTRCAECERASFGTADASLLDRFDFHDEQVQSACCCGMDWVIDLGTPAEGYSPVQYIIFRNAVMQQLDQPLEGAFWLYDELYKTEDGYEVHVLLDDLHELIECILTCDDVVLK